MTKVIWELGPNYSAPVKAKGYDLFDTTALWFEIDSDVPTSQLTLDPQNPNHPTSVVGPG